MWKIILAVLWTGLFSLGNTALADSLTLHSNWQFSKYGSDEWLPATVPGTVHQDLMALGKLPDPFYGMNEKEIQWVEDEDWLYRTSFVLSEEQLAHQEIFLVFDGLDTYADVSLSGACILKADNMFVGYRVPVKQVLRSGENKLLIRFRSPIREAMPQWKTNGFIYPAANDHRAERVSIFTRKAPYSYGWDWGIRMVTCGIWRPVRLEFANQAEIDDYFVCQQSVTSDWAEVDNRLEIRNLGNEIREAQVKVTYAYGQEESRSVEQTVRLQPGLNTVSLPLTIESPHLWMPNGWGEAALYDFRASVCMDGETVASQQHRIGLRSIRVVNEEDSLRKSY